VIFVNFYEKNYLEFFHGNFHGIVPWKNSMVILGNFHGNFPWKNSMEKSVS
jgi:hypothetical protein